MWASFGTASRAAQYRSLTSFRYFSKNLNTLKMIELRQLAIKHHIDLSDCFDKDEIVDKLKSADVTTDGNIGPQHPKPFPSPETNEHEKKQTKEGRFYTKNPEKKKDIERPPEPGENWLTDTFGKELITPRSSDSIRTTELLFDKDMICLLFGSLTDSTSRRLIPSLSHTYRQCNLLERQIVYASRDTSMANFERAYLNMPWLAIPYQNKALIEKHIIEYDIQSQTAILIFDVRTGRAKKFEKDTEIFNGMSVYLGLDDHLGGALPNKGQPY